NSETNDPAYFNTQLQILTGPGLLRRVAKNLDLEHNSDFLGDHPAANTSFWTSIRGVFGLNTKPASKSPTNVVPVTPASTKNTLDLNEAERLSDYVDELQLVLRVEP